MSVFSLPADQERNTNAEMLMSNAAVIVHTRLVRSDRELAIERRTTYAGENATGFNRSG